MEPTSSETFEPDATKITVTCPLKALNGLTENKGHPFDAGDKQPSIISYQKPDDDLMPGLHGNFLQEGQIVEYVNSHEVSMDLALRNISLRLEVE